MFGKGAIRGLAPEAAGNATTGMAMGALLALGLPVSATAAIMLAAFRCCSRTARTSSGPCWRASSSPWWCC